MGNAKARRDARRVYSVFSLLPTVAVTVLLGGSHPASATHFRYAHINWQHVGPAANKTIQYTVQAAWRQDGVSNGSGGNSYRCVNPASFVNQSTKLTTIACTGPVIAGKANPGVGDVFLEHIGDLFFDLGDGTKVGGPGGDALLFKVTSADATNNWVFGLAIDPNSLPAVDTTIQHTYANTNTRTAKLDDCCRISPCTSPNAHMNNPDDNYKVQTTVTVGSGDSSPVSSLPPIVLCPQSGLCTFQVPVSDNELDPVTFRLSTTAEAGFTSQPGSPQCPNAATIGSATGIYSWNTTGCRLANSGGSPPPSGGCSNAALNTLYSTQVMIEEPAKGTKTPVDFFIQLVPTCSLNSSPVFNSPPTPLCGSTVSAHPSNLVSFPIQSSDPNAADGVSLNAAGVPQGASISPTLPTSGNPVNATFSWTPAVGDLGQHVVTFTATDPCGLQQLCSITIDVSQEICNDGIDNDGDGLIDCLDPDCAGTPCSDGNACTTNDTCSGGPSGCVGGPAANCDDGNVCTTDGCNPGTGCTHANNSNACEDGNVCTTGDACSGGACVGGPAPSCDDGNACTTDTCVPGLGCQNPPLSNCQPCNSAADCDNLNACDGVETCVAGKCQSGTAPNCDDNNVCTDDGCAPASGCTHVNNSAPCNDGNACTTGDTCSGSVCTGGPPPNCDDGNLCTDDSCNSGSGCVHINNTASCTDNNACTQGDTCSAGACISGSTVTCTASDQCHDAGTCDPGSGCSNPAKSDGTGCSDGNACTTGDSCQSGACTSSPVICTASDQCHDVGTCDPGSGTCSNPAKSDGSSCDDGIACTLTDTCQDGICTGSPCSTSTPTSTPTPTGTAVVVEVPTSTPTPSLCGNGDMDPGEECDDGDNISGDCCSANCKLEPAGSPCDDGLVCTTGDVCDGFGICRGSPSIGDYAILRWATNDPSTSVQTLLGRKIVVRGHVCTDRIRTFRKARVAGDAVAMATTGAAISFARNSTVQGAVATGGGTVKRSTNAVVWGNIDASGVAPQLAACDDARARASVKYTELSARPVTAGFDEGLVKIKPGKSRRIPDTGTLPDGEVVIQLSELKVGRNAALKLVGSPTTTKVIVRISGPMRLGRGAAIQLEGLRAEQVIYVVSGLVRAGGSARLSGTVLGNDKITVYRINKIEGSLFGRTAIAARSTIIRRRPWVGWCD